MTINTPERLRQRVADHTTPIGDCLVWTGRLQAEGYPPSVSYRGERHMLYRVIYELETGHPVPPELTIDHTCHTRDRACRGGEECHHRRCLNWRHMEPVPHAENRRRAARSVCRNGHPRDEVNTYVTVEGWQVCRPCHAEQRRDRYKIHRKARRAEERGELA
jgi:hypothetical protein